MNMQNLMAQAQKMQRDIEKNKEKLNNTEFTGTSEWVDVVFNGNKELKSLKITYKEDIKEDDKEILEDMIKIAIKDAFKKIDEESEQAFGQYGSLGGLL